MEFESIQPLVKLPMDFTKTTDYGDSLKFANEKNSEAITNGYDLARFRT